jgi:hypothetical protein
VNNLFSQQNRTFILLWSKAPDDSILTPLWAVRHPAALAHESLIRHACISVWYVATGQRSMQPVLLEDYNLSMYAGKTLQAVSTVYNPSAGATLLFTVYAGVFVRFGWLSGATRFKNLLHCSACPDRYTSFRGATSVYDCFCKPGTYFHAETQACTPVSRQCPPLHFISSSDIQCTPCYTCPLGYYRDPYDCQSHVYRDPAKAVQCIQCTSCGPGYYINPERCNLTNVYDSDPKTDCIPCNRCESYFDVMYSVS